MSRERFYSQAGVCAVTVIFCKILKGGVATRLGCVHVLRKDPDAGKIEGRKRRGATEDEIVGWHH